MQYPPLLLACTLLVRLSSEDRLVVVEALLKAGANVNTGNVVRALEGPWPPTAEAMILKALFRVVRYLLHYSIH
jgi:hypothetical protein